jgi:hypothetical protein
MGYTKGPWIARGLPYNGFDDPVITTQDGTYIAQTVYDMQSNTQEHNINDDTLLIATAPDMYEALKAAEEVLEGLSKYIRPSQYKAIKMIGDALEKAEGRK